MSKILLFIFFLFGNNSYTQCLKADIVLMVDWSGSEVGNTAFIGNAVTDFTRSLNLGPSSIKLGIVPFDSNPILKWCVSLTSDKQILLSVSEQMWSVRPGGLTDYTGSLRLSDALFKKSALDRGEEVVKILIIVSDGIENEEYSEIISSELKKNGCLIWCIGTSSSPIKDDARKHLINISSGIEYYIEGDYESLRYELMRLDLCP